MKRGVVILLLIFLLGFSFIDAMHFASDVQLSVDGNSQTLQSAIDNEYFKTASHNYNSVPINSGHTTTQIWVSVNGVEKTLSDALSTAQGLCSSGAVISYSSNSIPNPSHLGTEIFLLSGKNLQQTINEGTYCCVPSCTGKTCGDNGCGGICGTCILGQNCINGVCITDCKPDGSQVLNESECCSGRMDFSTFRCIACESNMGQEGCSKNADCYIESGTFNCLGDCSIITPKAVGTDCNFQSGTCYGDDGGFLTPGLGTVVECLDPIGKCDATGNCISWAGKGCDNCPFGKSSHSCALNSTQGRASDKGKVWTQWHDDINPICESSYSCGFLWLDTCWSKKYWQIKPNN